MKSHARRCHQTRFRNSIRMNSQTDPTLVQCHSATRIPRTGAMAWVVVARWRVEGRVKAVLTQ
jgi:hypothetical protein